MLRKDFSEQQLDVSSFNRLNMDQLSNSPARNEKGQSSHRNKTLKLKPESEK